MGVKREFISHSVAETESFGAQLSRELCAGSVVAFFGGMGMGKTAMVRGIAQGLSLQSDVSSPTFALVHDYGGNPPLVHFDMYRVSGWDDLYSTGFFDYLDAGAILVVEWSENIAAALPADAIRIHISETGVDGERRIVWEV
ncbi:MAG: tRNA (adenosine(37)-N6)-threonylcarbamoyltransferase complex ATPase subunit type 1 TsaE [Ruminococcaceae bacterium]|nr:tRNA (adenosine(37)-N6)-threonylcarbamoyltransferase complex ATPase subunit type 1 TsaE [Oscillospiraceae bacterium]